MQVGVCNDCKVTPLVLSLLINYSDAIGGGLTL